MAEANYEFKKSTKYLLLFVFLLLLLGMGFVVRGFILPWLQAPVPHHSAPQIEIDESFLRSADLTTMIQFEHITHSNKRIGRENLLSWPTAQPEIEFEEPEELVETEEMEMEVEIEAE